jgi:hypothetical protein
MKSLMIKDLDLAKELSREERGAVRGGSNAAVLFGPVQNAQNGGFSFASPVVQVAPQTVTQNDTTVQIASVIASAGTLIAQDKVL